ncbi:amidase domain-containing protein [Acetivibrio cellulolyticus]|uniref:amidase domain-containing protein n=1 Tax=Acetivibrio cellulolyticus TaxID=35830 RepID=UPI0001E2E762|nr:amidase domain-containing protein [Acetivibrio cellulolyticus]
MYYCRTSYIADYNRDEAVKYAIKWALKRNPSYFDFEKLGGDCTNFASQVIFAGSGTMNYTPIYGWYYISSGKRTASWAGVNYLFDFLTGNKGSGPFAEQVDVRDVKAGDLIQLSFGGTPNYNHTPVVIKTGSTANLDNILIAAHTDDRFDYPITNYSWADIRFLHILGVRKP